MSALWQLRVFLCHAKEDKARITELYRRLKRDGHSPWLDSEDLLPGQEWSQELSRAVRHADVVLVCISTASITKRGFVQREIQIALDAASEVPPESIFIIPVRLEPCTLPERLTKYQWVDLFDADGYAKLNRALLRIQSGPFSTTPPPMRAGPAPLYRNLGSGALAPPSYNQLFLALKKSGISASDSRVRPFLLQAEDSSSVLPFEEFSAWIGANPDFLERAILDDLSIPRFAEFCDAIMSLYDACRQNESGAVADYSPVLAKAKGESWAVAVCTVDGQMFAVGDIDTPFVIDGCLAPLSYAMAIQMHGTDHVNRFIGAESTGLPVWALAFRGDGRPANPTMRSGLIMSSALILGGRNTATAIAELLEWWRNLCGGYRPKIDIAFAVSEEHSAANDKALAYKMMASSAFPDHVDSQRLELILQFSFMCRAISLDVKALAVAAATLANAGVCPSTGTKVLDSVHAQRVTRIMRTCGLHDFSGEFALRVGLPASAGVSGAMFMVVPQIMGVAMWSPRVDLSGNSVRGVQLCMELVSRFPEYAP